jgi:hypothetical protein
MSGIVPTLDTVSQWEDHFVDMAKGNIPLSDVYFVSMVQTPKSSSPLQKKDTDTSQILTSTHDPATGRIIDPVYLATDQSTKELKSVRPDYKSMLKGEDPHPIVSYESSQSSRKDTILPQKRKRSLQKEEDAEKEKEEKPNKKSRIQKKRKATKEEEIDIFS